MWYDREMKITTMKLIVSHMKILLSLWVLLTYRNYKVQSPSLQHLFKAKSLSC